MNMALPHPGIDRFTRYLKNEFPWKKNLDLSSVMTDKDVFSYDEVKEAINKLKLTDPTLHRILGYRWQTQRSRNAIANALYMDPSTVKRNWDRAINIIVNYLVNKECTAELEAIDLLYRD